MKSQSLLFKLIVINYYYWNFIFGFVDILEDKTLH